jgi:hypothetical protein
MNDENDETDYPFDGETPLGEQIDGGGDEGQEPNEDMDGDAGSALASAGFGTDEDYEHNLCDEGDGRGGDEFD